MKVQPIGNAEGASRWGSSSPQVEWPPVDQAAAAVARLAGISPHQLRQDMSTGKTLLEVARSKGVSDAAVMTAVRQTLASSMVGMHANPGTLKETAERIVHSRGGR